MKRVCDICGEIHDERDMMRIQPSRVMWLCWKCYKTGQYQAGHSQAQGAWDDNLLQWKRKRRSK